MSGQVDRLSGGKGFCDGQDVIDQSVQMIGPDLGRRIGQIDAPPVRRDHQPVFRQGRHLRRPAGPMIGKAVQENQRR
jgi:hypothetical protein